MIESPISSKKSATPHGASAASGGFADFLKQLGRRDLSQLPVLAALAAIAIYFNYFLGPDLNGIYLSPRNLSNLSLQFATTGTVALASVLVLLLGEIDLSLAAVSGFSGAFMAVLSARDHLSAPLVLLITLLVGLLIGAINGVLVAVIRVPSFIVTLAALIFYSGLLLHVLLPQVTIRVQDPGLTSISGSYLPDFLSIGMPIAGAVAYAIFIIGGRVIRQRRGLEVPPLWDPLMRIGLVTLIVIGVISVYESYLGIPINLTILFGLVMVFWIVLRFTTFGRHVYATGGNAEAARRAGINTVMVRVTVFAMASMLAAASGILESSREISASAQVDPTLLLNAIAAAVIGGVSLFGGRGSTWAVFMGGLVIVGLQNGLALRSASGDIQQMIEGAVLILAIMLDALIRRRNAVSGR